MTLAGPPQRPASAHLRADGHVVVNMRVCRVIGANVLDADPAVAVPIDIPAGMAVQFMMIISA